LKKDDPFIIHYEGNIADKLEKKAKKMINRSRPYALPHNIKQHFVLFRDTEKDSQYGILHFDFDAKIINYFGPVYGENEWLFRDLKTVKDLKPRRTPKFVWDNTSDGLNNNNGNRVKS
jgi:hypothetical protein